MKIEISKKDIPTLLSILNVEIGRDKEGITTISNPRLSCATPEIVKKDTKFLENRIKIATKIINQINN